VTYKVIIYGRHIETEEFEDLQELITEVHYLLEHKLGKGRITGFHVSVS